MSRKSTYAFILTEIMMACLCPLTFSACCLGLLSFYPHYNSESLSREASCLFPCPCWPVFSPKSCNIKQFLPCSVHVALHPIPDSGLLSADFLCLHFLRYCPHFTGPSTGTSFHSCCLKTWSCHKDLCTFYLYSFIWNVFFCRHS